jgi:hypothetical protein
MAGNRPKQLAADQKMIEGVNKHLAQFASLSVAGQIVSSTDIVKVLQTRIDVSKAATAADAARTEAVKADHDEHAKTALFVSSLRRVVVGMFITSPETLAEFGLTAPKAGKPSAATKAAAVAKNKATRKARGTVGPKKKLAIHGNVEPPAPTKGP